MKKMLKKDFWYDLPKELIAQEPADPRDAARLMVLDRKNDKIPDRYSMSCPIILKRAICSLSITPRSARPPDGHQGAHRCCL